MEPGPASRRGRTGEADTWPLRGPLANDPKAHILHAVFLGLLLWLALYSLAILPFIAAGGLQAGLLSFPFAFVCVASLSLLRRGHMQSAIWVSTAGGWLLATLVIVLSGGIRSPALAIYIGLPVLAIWVMGRRAALVSAGVCTASALILAIADLRGVHLPRFFGNSPIEIWSVFLLAAFIAAVPMTHVLQGLTEALAASRLQLEDLRNAQEAVKRSEETYRILFESAQEAILLADMQDARILDANPAACALYGYSRYEFRGLGVFHLASDPRSSLDTFRDGAQRDRLLLHRKKDGTVFPAEASTGCFVLGGRDMRIAFIRDVTERKRAEQAVQASEEELRKINEELERRVQERTAELEDARQAALSMMQDAYIQTQRAEDALQRLAESAENMTMLWQSVETSPAVVVITDIEGTIQYVNPKFVEVTGYAADEAVGQNPRILNSGEHPLEFYQTLWTTIKAGKTWFGEFCNKKKNGELYWEAASISPVRAADGQIRQFLAIKEDVTEIKRTSRELQRAKEAAETANRAKSAFLASMSHEIRTPLNAILGYSQLVLRDDSLSASSKESLRILNRSGEHLLALINNVLEVSKIEAGRVGLEPVEFDLHALLADLEAMFRLRTAEKGLEFEVTGVRSLPRYAIADEGKIRQMLVNLLGNAVKFTAQGRIAMRAAVNHSTTGQLLLAVEVEDTGAGIAPEEMGRLFRHFEQTQSGRDTQSGTGLGLVISRDYANRMGGDISVASERGKGSVFRLEIPIAPGVGLAAAAVTNGRRVVSLAPEQPRCRVLLADDHEANRGWLAALLDSVGFQVREAAEGQEAVDIWQSWQPDLVLMDMRMPVMDGYEATRRIRALPGGDSTVIIALTASTFDERVPAMMNAGVDDLVCKPFKEGDLFAKIGTHLGVKYRYEDSEVFAEAQRASVLTPAALASLPEALRVRMQEAILSCDMDSFAQVLPEVAEQDASLAAGLRTLADNYDYDGLTRLLEDRQ